MKNPADMNLEELMQVRDALQRVGSKANETLINAAQHLTHIETRIAMIVGLPPMSGDQMWNEQWIDEVIGK